MKWNFSHVRNSDQNKISLSFFSSLLHGERLMRHSVQTFLSIIHHLPNLPANLHSHTFPLEISSLSSYLPSLPWLDPFFRGVDTVEGRKEINKIRKWRNSFPNRADILIYIINQGMIDDFHRLLFLTPSPHRLILMFSYEEMTSCFLF